MYHLLMILTILGFLFGALVLLGLALAAVLPIIKFLFVYGSERDDWYSTFDEELSD